METQAPTSANLASSVVKAKYRVTNWPEYDHALVQRGRLTVWFDEDLSEITGVLSARPAWSAAEVLGYGHSGVADVEGDVPSDVSRLGGV